MWVSLAINLDDALIGITTLFVEPLVNGPGG
jgi:hypothetical protein